MAAELTFTSGPFSASCSSGSDGRFEVELQRNGAWSGTVATADDRRRFHVEILEGAPAALGLELESLPQLESSGELPR